MLASVLAVTAGASAGTWLRWGLSSLNTLFPFLPLGTLTANLLGGYLAGVAFSLFSLFPSLQPEWRLLVLTGFLGTLTTFSAFSLEVVLLLQQGRMAWAAGTVAANVCGSLLLTMLGMGTVTLARQMFS
ncbi:MAG: fluoride efflux transporter CrcB [Desulfovibrionaceae bacterium]|nr:fluoride efflux transporter CrcB [Desulfovibrionaceae bacterium]